MKLLMAAGIFWIATLPLSADEQSALLQGQKDYAQGGYLEALAEFQKVLADPDGRQNAAAFLGIAKTYFFLLDTRSAAHNLDYYLQTFPQDPQRPEGLYLQARILYTDGDFDHAIEAFGAYLDAAPQGENVSNALYWMGESAFSLGHYQEASSLFTKVVQGYPKSFKVEAARYRLSLIGLQRREDELLKLLQWSHTEALNSSDDFRRRELVYEQELAAFQKEILALKSTDSGAQVAALEEELKSKAALIAALKTVPTTTVTPQPSADSTTLQLLNLKVQALTLKAELLQGKLSHGS